MKDDITAQESQDYWLSQGEALSRDIMEDRKDNNEERPEQD